MVIIARWLSGQANHKFTISSPHPPMSLFCMYNTVLIRQSSYLTSVLFLEESSSSLNNVVRNFDKDEEKKDRYSK